MEYLELGEVFKINTNDKTVYLKVEIDNSEILCENCYFNQKGIRCPEKTNCAKIERNDNNNIIYRQIEPTQDIFVVFGIRNNEFVTQWHSYLNEEDAKKAIERLNKYSSDCSYHYRMSKYYPYDIIDDIKEVEINQQFLYGEVNTI